MSRIQNPGGGLQSRVLHLMVESRKQIPMIQLQNWKQNRFGHLGLVFGACLEFVILDF